MNYVIDRFEGKYAVLEYGIDSFINIPIELVDGAVEGDIVQIKILKEEREDIEDNIQKLMDIVFED